MRLQRYLAACGVASRRKCEELISAGRVRVNGAAAGLGSSVSEDDAVTLDGAPVAAERELVYIMLHKPKGCVTTVSDQFGRKTVMDYISGVPCRIAPVGRLDYGTSGLLLLTNDGIFANDLTHPSRRVPKTYIASVSGRLGKDALSRLRSGVRIPDKSGEVLTAPAKARVLGDGSRLRAENAAEMTAVEITITEGRNRQVRKMFSAVGHEVIDLKRVAIGPLSLGGLACGQFRRLTAVEVEGLRDYLKSSPHN